MVPLPSFTRSKWEWVDEAELIAHAMAVSMWDRLEVWSDGGRMMEPGMRRTSTVFRCWRLLPLCRPTTEIPELTGSDRCLGK